MRSDDLAPLLVPPPPPAGNVTFRQGVIISWNPLTAENVVNVGGTNLTNLPTIASNAEVRAMKEGDVVGIQSVGNGAVSTMYIIGRVVTPGTAQAASALRLVSDQIVAGSDMTEGERSGSTANVYSWGDLTGTSVGPAVTITVGNSGKALVIFSAEIGWGAPVPQGTGAWASVEVTGATTIAASGLWALGRNDNPTNEAGRLGIGRHKLFTGLNPGEHTFTMKYAVFPIGSNTAVTCSFMEREIAVFAM